MATVPEKTKRKNRKSFLFAMAAVVVIVLVGTGTYLLLNNWPFGGDQNSSPTPAAVVDGNGAPTKTATIAPPTDVEKNWKQVQEVANGGDLSGAVAILRQMREDYPDYESALITSRLEELCTTWFADSSEQAEPDLLDALDCLEEIGTEPPGGGEVRLWWEDYFQAGASLSAGRSDEAIALLGPLVAAAPVDFAGGLHRMLLYEAYLQKGDILCSQAETDADYDTARAAYLEARMLDPSRGEAEKRLDSCQPPTPTPTITPTATFTPTPLPPGAMKAMFDPDEGGRFNVRSGPGYNYPIIDIVEPGAIFTINARTEDAEWLQAVQEDGKDVWVWADLLKTNYPPEAALVVDQTPIPPTDYVVADSVADFGFPQGTNRWYYLASETPGSLKFVQIPRDGGWYRWTVDRSRSPAMRLSAEGSYPSWNSDAMRMWVNFYEDTKLRIEGQARKEAEAGTGGNGVILRIVHRRPDGDSSIFETERWRGELGSHDTAGFNIQVEPFEVKQRDEIYFITSAKGDDDEDNTIFTAQIILMNEGGAIIAPTPTPTPTPTKPTPPSLCFEPTLRHFEEHKGCCGEVVGIVHGLSWGEVNIKGPPADQQYERNFGIAKDGGYSITALTTFPLEGIYYTLKLRGPRIKSGRYVVRYEDAAKLRAVVDWYQVACK